jgi:hypothetical protein
VGESEKGVSNTRTCYICVQPGADTDDHLIPRAFFPPPRPTNLITLPAHSRCHNRHDEDYARAIIAGVCESPTAERVRALRVRPSLVRSDLKGTKLRRDLIRALMPPTNAVTPAGLIVGRVQGVRFNRDRVYPMLKKIVRGLHYRHSGRFLTPDAEFSWKLDEPLNETTTAIFQACSAGVSYPGVFECRYGFGTGAGVEGSVWWLRFYEDRVFHCITRVAIRATST